MSSNQEVKWYGWGTPGKEFDLSRRNNFLPFLSERLQLAGNEKTPPVDFSEIELPPADQTGLASRFEKIVGDGGVRSDSSARIRHATGKSYLDLIRVRRGIIENPPDLVLYPETESQLIAVLRLAADERAAIIPFGGGTSVVGGVEALKGEGHTAAVSLDMCRLNRLLNIDEISLIATIEAGILGPALENQLQKSGYTLGHYPQSFEFSTLGGWLATRSAGQQSNKYGKIEHMCTSLALATPEEIFSTLDVPASAAVPSIKELLIGSEGVFGVITQAKMRIQRKPESKIYRGVLFKNFFLGAQAVRTIVQLGLEPAMARLSDEAETEAIMKMRKESESIFESALAKAGRWYLKNRGYSSSTCLMIIGFEDSEQHAAKNMKAALEICRNYEGIDLGTRVGGLWYKDRFELPYLRDSVLDMGIMLDTLETATTWTNLLDLYGRVKEALTEAIKGFHYHASPAVLCHISHSYPDGASLYYTFMSKQAKGAEIDQWRAAKEAASEAISASGATISHHHGVGRDHARWARREHGRLGSLALSSVKAALDPIGILNPGKLLS